MNTKVKIAAIMVLTLVLGIFIGAMANRALMHNRIRRTFTMNDPARFPMRIIEIIQPDGAQEVQLKEILDRHSNKLFESRENFMKESRAVWETLMKEIETILTPEQKERLKNRERLMRRMSPDMKMRGRRSGRGKPLLKEEKKYPFPF